MKKSMIVITSLLAVTLLATSAFSWGHGNGGCGGSGQGYGTNALNDLSKEQRDELSALRQKFIDETYEVRSAMMVKHQEMRMLMETSSPDRAKLDTLSQEFTDLRSQMQSKRIDFQLAAKKIAPELNVAGMGGHGGCGGMSSKGDNGGKGNCPGQGRGYRQ
ncbi:MAG: periplasmic heavy metal sensor [Desulfobacteraceae bacterium]|nr:periplasmic heavy metal sensor [Desulfobacteraceae bacterium]